MDKKKLFRELPRRTRMKIMAKTAAWPLVGVIPMCIAILLIEPIAVIITCARIDISVDLFMEEMPVLSPLIVFVPILISYIGYRVVGVVTEKYRLWLDLKIVKLRTLTLICFGVIILATGFKVGRPSGILDVYVALVLALRLTVWYVYFWWQDFLKVKMAAVARSTAEALKKEFEELDREFEEMSQRLADEEELERLFNENG